MILTYEGWLVSDVAMFCKLQFFILRFQFEHHLVFKVVCSAT